MKKLTTALALAISTLPAQAATGTWIGGGATNNISESGNWSGFAVAQTTGGTWTFDGSTRLTPINDLAFNGATDTGITFAAGAGAFSLSGTNVRSGGITNSSSNLQTIGFGVRFNGTRTIDTGTAGINFTSVPASTGTGRAISKNGAGDMTISVAGTTTNLNFTVNAGNIASANATGTLILPGTLALVNSTNALKLNQAGTANVTGIISGAGSVVKSGTGSSTLSGLNTYTGGTTIQSGILTVANSFTMSGSNGFSLIGSASPVAGTDNGSITATLGNFNYGGTLALNFTGTAVAGATYNLFNIAGATLGGSFSNISIGGSYSVPASAPISGVWSASNSGLNFVFTEATGNLLITSAVPEPSSFAALAGLGILGFAATRRRRTA